MSRRRLSTRERAEPLRIRPLSDEERGRGVHLPNERETEIVAECLRLMRAGVRQHEIARALNGSRSRVARWCQAAALQLGTYEDRARLKTRGKTEGQFLWSRIDVRGRDECWPWMGSLRENGYGSLCNMPSGHKTAHRAVYALLVGPITEGEQVDHICNNPRCCNPRHLQAVSPTVNLYLRKARADAAS